MALAPGSAPQALGRRGASGTREDGVDNAHSIPRYSGLPLIWPWRQRPK